MSRSEEMKSKKFLVLLLCVIMLFSLVACGGSSSSVSSGSYKAENTANYAGFTDSYNYATDEYYESEVEDYDSTITASNGTESKITSNEKLVYTASVDIETKNITDALEAINSVIKENGGIIQNKELNNMDSVYRSPEYYNSGYYYRDTSSAYIFVRVPQQNYEKFMDSLNDNGNNLYVTDTKESVENLTSTYYDIESRLNSLRVEEKRLFEFLESADTVSDMLEVEKRLSNVQYEIESATNQLRTINTDVDYAKVTINVQEVIQYTEQVKNPQTFGERLANAFKSSWKDFAYDLEDFIEDFVYAIPRLLVFAVFVVVVVIIVKKNKNKIKAKTSKLKKNPEDLPDWVKEQQEKKNGK